MNWTIFGLMNNVLVLMSLPSLITHPRRPTAGTSG